MNIFFYQNPDSPYDNNSAYCFRNNRAIFDKRIKYFTEKYANPSLPYKEYDSWDFSLPHELE